MLRSALHTLVFDIILHLDPCWRSDLQLFYHSAAAAAAVDRTATVCGTAGGLSHLAADPKHDWQLLEPPYAKMFLKKPTGDRLAASFRMSECLPEFHLFIFPTKQATMARE